MTARVKQPYWSADGRIDEAQWKGLEAAGGVQLSAAQRDQFIEAVNRYREFTAGERAAIPTGKLRAILEHLAKSLGGVDGALASLLRSQPPDSTAAVRELQKAAARKCKTYAGRRELKEFHSQVRMWRAYARAALEALPRGTGREGDPHIDDFLVAALTVFKAAGGRGRYTPEATAFRTAACEIIGYNVHSRGSLEQRVKEVWRKLRRNSPS